MNSLFETIAENPAVSLALGIVALGLMLLIAARILIARARRRTRCELAAYVAEGTMTADEADRILNAGKPSCLCAAARPERRTCNRNPDDTEPLFEAVPTRSSRP